VSDALELVIFDCDGVLVDSEPIAIRIETTILAEQGMPLSEAEIVKRFVGRSQSVMTTALEEHLGHALPDDWNDRYRERFNEAYLAELKPIDGIEQALDEIIPLPVCVASSSEPDRLLYKLELCGLRPRFEGRIFSASEVENGKPAPDLFLHAASRMGADPARCAVVEDSRYGVQAARAAGMAAFGYAGSVTPGADLEGPGTAVFDDMRELPALLRQLRAG
jgi:HAD superfamily hydrolase (TIGR01509 family)